MNALAVFYHAHPIVWTVAIFGVAYVYGRGDTDRRLDHWRELHHKTFHCAARPPENARSAPARHPPPDRSPQP